MASSCNAMTVSGANPEESKALARITVARTPTYRDRRVLTTVSGWFGSWGWHAVL
jgi:hypothetical protein